jgi:hypothetical protein
VKPGAAISALTAQVVIPAGSVVKLQSSLRTLAADDITTADLGKLTLDVSGTPLTRDQFTFSNVGYDAQGQYVATLNVTNASMMPGSVLTMRTPSGNFALKTIVSASGSGTRVDLNSTARALLAEQLSKSGKAIDPDSIPAASVDLVADRLATLLTSGANQDVLAASKLVTAVESVATAVSNGLGSDATTLSQIQTSTNTDNPGSTGGNGGGGGGTVAPVLKLSGTVTVEGNARDQAMVQLSTMGGIVVAKTATDDTGAYAFYDIPAGTYFLIVAVNGAEPKTQTVVIN